MTDTKNNEKQSAEQEITKYSARDNSKEIRRSMQEVKDEIKNALPTAKDVTEDGNTITFTMPNNSKIVVDVQTQIALTAEQLAQAKKDHNIDGNVVVEGYAKKYGKDAYIALSQGSRKGTGYHEVYHVAEDTVLNDKEKAALRKKYPNEEMRADKYAEWVEARKNGKGTLFGKLFRKIQDFAKKMQSILTHTENVHDVFRKIESGKVWNRKAGTTNSDKYAITNKKITSHTEIPVIDVTGERKVNVNNNKEIVEIAKHLKGATFTTNTNGGKAVVYSMLDGKHIVHGSKHPTRNSPVRRRALSKTEELLNNAIYVDKHMDVDHGEDKKYIEFFVP